jgi:hypothetical protein
MDGIFESDETEQSQIVARLQNCFAVSGHDESGVTISWEDALTLVNILR